MPLSPQPPDTLMPGDNLVVEGIPPIPQTLAAQAARFTEFRLAINLDWHPLKREMLLSTRFGDTAQIHGIKTPLGDRKQMTFFADRVGGAKFEPTHGDYFVFSKDAGGNEFAQNYRFDLASGEITLLTDGRSQNSLGRWSHAGDKMAYRSTRRTGKDSDIYVIHPADPSTDRCVGEFTGGGWSVADWFPDDQSLLISEYVSVNESYLWRLDLATGARTLLTPRTEERVSYGQAKFSPDGRSLYVTTDKGSEFGRLACLDLETGEHHSLTPDIGWDVEEFALSPSGQTLVFVVNEDGAGVLHGLDTATGQALFVPTLPLGLASNLRFHPQGGVLAFDLISARAPSDIYTWDLETDTVARWTESETGGLPTENFALPELVRWPSFDGLSVSGFLYRAPARFPGKRPVMIVIHGGPEAQFRPVYLGRTNYYLNEMGVSVLYPNVRGSSGYGKTFLDLDNGLKREDSYRDISALLDWIAEQPDLDSERVMVTGGSYGGHMTLALAVRENQRIRCSLDIVGMSNLVTFLENTEAYRQDLRRVEYGDERDPEMRAFLESIAPLNQAQNITKPLFIVQGKNDPRVPYTEALQMAATVRANHAPVWFLMANDEGHGFAKKSNADFLFYSTIAFVQQYLVND